MHTYTKWYMHTYTKNMSCQVDYHAHAVYAQVPITNTDVNTCLYTVPEF